MEKRICLKENSDCEGITEQLGKRKGITKKTIRKREDEKDGKSKNTFFQKIRP